jgi:hypothetical protein
MVTYAFDYVWFLIHTDSKWQNIVKWFGSFLIGLAAFIFTVVPETGVAPWLLTIFFVGHVIWVFAAWMIREPSLIWLNAFFALIDAYGIIIRL